jgi:hypothetical protein
MTFQKASAYHFFCDKTNDEDTVFVGPYVDLYNIRNINQFAGKYQKNNQKICLVLLQVVLSFKFE